MPSARTRRRESSTSASTSSTTPRRRRCICAWLRSEPLMQGRVWTVLGLCDDNPHRTACAKSLRTEVGGSTVVAADHAPSYARKLGIQRDQVVQEWGWDED